MKTPHKFELHVHTAESSQCSHLAAKEMVELYHAAGYSGLATTDHLHDYLLASWYKNNWDSYIDYLLHGYKIAKFHGDRLGLSVILGLEISFTKTPGDFLVYGLTEAFLRANPFLHRRHLKEFFSLYNKQLTIIHAHPYRGGNEKVFPKHVHGIEIFNGNPHHPNPGNHKAKTLSIKHPKLITTSASDAHSARDTCTGWLELSRPVADAQQLQDVLRRKDYNLAQA